MRAVEAFGLLVIMSILVISIIYVIRAAFSTGGKWELEEHEGTADYIAFFAVKPRHEPQRLSPWRSSYDPDFAAFWAEDRALAESKITYMNLNKRKQIGY